MQKYLLIFFIFVLAAASIINCSPINAEEDPTNLRDLNEMYTCQKVAKNSCKTREIRKCHRKRILNHVYKLCVDIPEEECTIKYENVCIRKKPNFDDFDYKFRPY